MGKNLNKIHNMLRGLTPNANKTISIAGNKKEKREVGDIWEDEYHRYEQKDGFVLKTSKQHAALQEVRDTLFIPDNCPNCKNPMKKRLDPKFYFKRGMCFDCSIEEEHKMRVDGSYEQFEQKMILKNQLGHLKDVKAELEDYINTDMSQKHVNSDGTIDSWDGDDNIKAICIAALEDVEKMIINFQKRIDDVEGKTDTSKSSSSR